MEWRGDVLVRAASNLERSTTAEVCVHSGVENKHQWLYLHQLANIATVRKLAEFYVTSPHEA